MDSAIKWRTFRVTDKINIIPQVVVVVVVVVVPIGMCQLALLLGLTMLMLKTVTSIHEETEGFVPTVDLSSCSRNLQDVCWWQLAKVIV
jgi:hypothetical protein